MKHWPWIILLLLAPAGPAWSACIAVVMDDMGNQWTLGKRIVNLPGPVAIAILPGTPFARRLGQLAHAKGKEILAHLPMESADDQPLGPYALRLEMTEAAFESQLHSALATIPFVSGVSNHMGSLLTRHPGHMAWLMEALHTHGGWYFLDSRTTARTVAEELAREYAIPALHRDVFLDDVRTVTAVAEQFRRLVDLARRRGSALAIGHPYPTTLDALERLLPTLAAGDVELVAPHALLTFDEQAGNSLLLSSEKSSLGVTHETRPTIQSGSTKNAAIRRRIGNGAGATSTAQRLDRCDPLDAWPRSHTSFGRPTLLARKAMNVRPISPH